MRWGGPPLTGPPSYIGYLGHLAAYVLTFALLMAQTLQVFGTPEIDVPPEAALEGLHLQLVGCHSLIAMWGWRTLTSAIEELEIPPLFSLRGLIVHYVPTYYLWITLLFVAMVATTPEHNETVSRHAKRYLIGRSTLRPGMPNSSQSFNLLFSPLFIITRTLL